MTAFGSLTEGLGPNLLAELIGFLVGTGATYLIVHRVVEQAEKRANEPLRARFKEQVGQRVSGMYLMWRLELDLVTVEELKNSVSDDLNTHVARDTESLNEYLKLVDLAAEQTGTRRFEGIRNQVADERLREMAAEIVQDAKAVAAAADRLSDVLSRSPQLWAKLADAESQARYLESGIQLSRMASDVEGPDRIAMMGMINGALSTMEAYFDLWREMDEGPMK